MRPGSHAEPRLGRESGILEEQELIARRSREAPCIQIGMPTLTGMRRSPNTASSATCSTAALVDTGGTVDWYCPGRFDAPSVFASLLDPQRGGFFRIAPTGQDWTTRQLYLPDSAVLVTRFLGTDGVAEVVDFMPVTGRATDTPHVLVRLVRVVSGNVRLAVRLRTAFRLRPSAAQADM